MHAVTSMQASSSPTWRALGGGSPLRRGCMLFLMDTLSTPPRSAFTTRARWGSPSASSGCWPCAHGEACHQQQAPSKLWASMLPIMQSELSCAARQPEAS